MAYGGLNDVAFIAPDKSSPVTMTARVTNANNSATSQFVLKDTNGPILGSQNQQVSSASFTVPNSVIARNPGSVLLEILPVSQTPGDITLWIQAWQNGAPLQWSDQGNPTAQGPYGVNAGQAALNANAGSVISFL